MTPKRIKYGIDERIQDEGIDALRHSLYKSREEQARLEGKREGIDEGIEIGRELGWNAALDRVMELILEYRGGTRQW